MQKKYLLIIALFMIQAALMQPAGAVSSVSLQGSGSSFVNPVMQNWVTLFAQKSNGPVQIAYSSVGSGSGKSNLIANTTDFAGSDSPLTPEEVTNLNGRIVLTIPVTIGGIVMIYNIPGLVGSLNLTSQDIAGICEGTITHWNDSEILKNNLGLNSTAVIIQVHGSTISGNSYTFSDFLNRSAPTVWSHGVTSDLSGIGGIGSFHYGNAIVVKTHNNSIGYVELNYAVESSLSFARIQNKDGNWITATPVADEKEN